MSADDGYDDGLGKIESVSPPFEADPENPIVSIRNDEEDPPAVILTYADGSMVRKPGHVVPEGQPLDRDVYDDLYRLVDAVDPDRLREQFLLPDLGKRGVAQAVHNHRQTEACTFRCPAHYAGGIFMSEHDSTNDLVEVYQDAAHKFRWRFKDVNNDLTMADSGQGYQFRRDALHGISRVTGRIPTVVQGKASVAAMNGAQIAVVFV